MLLLVSTQVPGSIFAEDGLGAGVAVVDDLAEGVVAGVGSAKGENEIVGIGTNRVAGVAGVGEGDGVVGVVVGENVGIGGCGALQQQQTVRAAVHGEVLEREVRNGCVVAQNDVSGTAEGAVGAAIGQRVGCHGHLLDRGRAGVAAAAGQVDRVACSVGAVAR